LSRAALIPVLLASAALDAQPRGGEGQLDASETLFTVLAAINAAGYDADLESPASHPFRKTLREEIARRNPPSLAKIREFYVEHRQEDAVWELRQYVSFGLVTEAPKFRFRVTEYQLPPDVAALAPLGPLLERFHAEAGIAELWRAAQPAFEAAIARYHEPVTLALLELNGYLRNPTSAGFRGKRFQIYVDILGAPNQIHVRSFIDEYFVVVTPSAELHLGDIRQTYLHSLIDPMATNASAELEKKRALGDYALGAQHLADHYKQDFLLLAARSLARAIEARLAPAARREAMVTQALREGFILTPHFSEQLPIYEKQEQSMRLYFPEMIKSIDLRREERRLAQVEFLEAPVVRRARAVAPPKPPEPTGAEKSLREAEAAYDARQLDQARAAWLRAIEETPDKPLQARAYHGLARVAALQKNPELAEKLFQRTLELEPDPPTRCWTLVFLGRLMDAAGERQEAVGHYQAALDTAGCPAQPRKLAETEIKESLKPRSN
jgi:tetratricopeptide (TPR) repeat protein